jgi:hypothetical protein
MNSADDLNDLKNIQNLIKRIKELKEIVSESKPKLSQEIPPTGYTATRWQLALQSFNERLPVLKSRNYLNFRSVTNGEEGGGEEFLIEFGPEWDLKCAQNELEKLLNKSTSF